MNKTLLLILGKELKARVREVAYKNNMSMNKLIRICIMEKLKFTQSKKEVQEENGTGPIGHTRDGDANDGVTNDEYGNSTVGGSRTGNIPDTN